MNATNDENDEGIEVEVLTLPADAVLPMGFTRIANGSGGYKAKAGERTGNNFIDKSQIRQWKYLYFKATNVDSGQFKVRADISGGSDKNIVDLTVNRFDYVGFSTSSSVLQNANALFPAGYCTGLSFDVYGSNG